MGLIKILNISHTDWANFQYDNMMALRSVGLNCDSVTVCQHPFYENQSESHDLKNIKEMIRDYDVIQFFHDNVGLYVQLVPYLTGKRVFVYHTSSYYRANFKHVNNVMFEAEKHVACMPEFVHLHPKSIYMVGAIDTEKIKPMGFESVYKFAHFPSNPKVKGTETIFSAFQELDLSSEFCFHTDSVPHKSQLSRIDDCEVYIEMCTEKDNLGSVYGNFGITALEAAALGKIVITQCRDIDVYLNVYGSCPFDLINSKDKLKRTILSWSNYEADHLRGQQKSTREWVVKNHSYKATGDYFIKNVLNGL